MIDSLAVTKDTQDILGILDIISANQASSLEYIEGNQKRKSILSFENKTLASSKMQVRKFAANLDMYRRVPGDLMVSDL